MKLGQVSSSPKIKFYIIQNMKYFQVNYNCVIEVQVQQCKDCFSSPWSSAEDSGLKKECFEFQLGTKGAYPVWTTKCGGPLESCKEVGLIPGPPGPEWRVSRWRHMEWFQVSTKAVKMMPQNNFKTRNKHSRVAPGLLRHLQEGKSKQVL